MRSHARHLLTSALTAVLLGGFAVSGCSGGGDSGDSGAPTSANEDGGSCGPFVAQTIDFQGFCNWSSAPASAAGDASDGIHGLGPLRVYWNKSPPKGSTQFPVGTIILKESQEADPTKRTAFVMVKRDCRGDGFNPASMGGADGWEWWSVQDLGNCAIARLWRGTAPPSGESYTGTPGGDCNTCHAQVVDNDYVWDTALQLTNF